MAGTLVIDTLKASTGVLATQNGMNGIAKAWVQYDGVSQTILNSFNVSSVTYQATGYYTVNMTTAMPSANYAVNVQTNGVVNTAHAVGLFCDGSTTYGSTVPAAPTTTAFSVYFTNPANGSQPANQPKCCMAVFA